MCVQHIHSRHRQDCGSRTGYKSFSNARNTELHTHTYRAYERNDMRVVARDCETGVRPQIIRRGGDRFWRSLSVHSLSKSVSCLVVNVGSCQWRGASSRRSMDVSSEYAKLGLQSDLFSVCMRLEAFSADAFGFGAGRAIFMVGEFNLTKCCVGAYCSVFLCVCMRAGV